MGNYFSYENKRELEEWANTYYCHSDYYNLSSSDTYERTKNYDYYNGNRFFVIPKPFVRDYQWIEDLEVEAL